MRLEKLVKVILSKIEENFCKGLDFGIKTQVCSYNKVLLISISNPSISFLIYFNQI